MGGISFSLWHISWNYSSWLISKSSSFHEKKRTKRLISSHSERFHSICRTFFSEHVTTHFPLLCSCLRESVHPFPQNKIITASNQPSHAHGKNLGEFNSNRKFHNQWGPITWEILTILAIEISDLQQGLWPLVPPQKITWWWLNQQKKTMNSSNHEKQN